MPVDRASKAAVHSFTAPLRHQLAGTSVRVVEVIPPAVETALHRHLARKLSRHKARVSPRLFLRIINQADKRA